MAQRPSASAVESIRRSRWWLVVAFVFAIWGLSVPNVIAAKFLAAVAVYYVGFWFYYGPTIQRLIQRFKRT